jgi:hypothetical protein
LPWVKVPVLSEQISLQPKSEYGSQHCQPKNIRDTTEGFESVETTDDDTILGHSAGTSGHGDGQDGNKAFWYDGNG